MKHKKLSEALNEISDRHIAQAFKRTKRSYRLAGIAAALALVILALSFAGISSGSRSGKGMASAVIDLMDFTTVSIS